MRYESKSGACLDTTAYERDILTQHVPIAVLAASLLTEITCKTCKEKNVLFRSVALRLQAPQNGQTAAMVKVLGDALKLCTQVWERK